MIFVFYELRDDPWTINKIGLIGMDINTQFMNCVTDPKFRESFMILLIPINVSEIYKSILCINTSWILNSNQVDINVSNRLTSNYWLSMSMYLHNVGFMNCCHLLSSHFFSIFKCKSCHSFRVIIRDNFHTFNYTAYTLKNTRSHYSKRSLHKCSNDVIVCPHILTYIY